MRPEPRIDPKTPVVLRETVVGSSGANARRLLATGSSNAEARTAADLACIELAGRQHGAITLRQLHECGLSDSAIRHRVRHGWLRRLHRGVYTVGAGLTWHMLEHGAALALGPRAFVAGASAAYLRRFLDYPKQPYAIEVAVPGRCPVSRPGIKVRHVARLRPGDVEEVDGIRVSSVARTLLAVASIAPIRLEAAFDEAAFQDRAGTVRETNALCRRLPGVRGVPLLRELVAAETGGRRSRLEGEKRLLALIRSAGLPEPEINGGLGPYRIDMIWRQHGVAVEMDGFSTHSKRTSFEGDRARDAALQARGFRVVRFTWRQITREPSVVIVRLAAVLAIAGA